MRQRWRSACPGSRPDLSTFPLVSCISLLFLSSSLICLSPPEATRSPGEDGDVVLERGQVIGLSCLKNSLDQLGMSATNVTAGVYAASSLLENEIQTPHFPFCAGWPCGSLAQVEFSERKEWQLRKASIRSGCGAFLNYGRGPRPLWVEPPLGWWSWVLEESRLSKPW